MVRLSAEGREGKFIRDEIMKSLWVDVSKKSRKLGVSKLHFLLITMCINLFPVTSIVVLFSLNNINLISFIFK